jgi:hypothetical protein
MSMGAILVAIARLLYGSRPARLDHELSKIELSFPGRKIMAIAASVPEHEELNLAEFSFSRPGQHSFESQGHPAAVGRDRELI